MMEKIHEKKVKETMIYYSFHTIILNVRRREEWERKGQLFKKRALFSSSQVMVVG